ncbi:MAG TPA: proton-conducting transporter membrane subunit [Candidatus Binatia bacterium]
MIAASYPIYILLAPLAWGFLVACLGRSFGPKAARIGVVFEVIAFALSLFLLFDVTTGGPKIIEPAHVAGLFPIRFYIDRLSAVMLVHIAAISILIHLFSVRYMQQERGYARFHALLAFTTAVLFGMVTSGNLLVLFVFWQLISWLVPLLSYNYSHVPTVLGSFRTFIMQRAGDVALLAAIVLAQAEFGTVDLQQLPARAASMQTSLVVWSGFQIAAATVLTLLIFVAAMSKSAQIPFHMWLPDSLYAPTPVHALLHAGIINAGGFLLARLAPLYSLTPLTLHVVFAVGMMTAILGSSMMLVQNDIKKTLGYSTIGQMGFMIMECGLGAYALAIFHLIAHGLFKASTFLNCGYVIHAARQEPRFPAPKDKTVDSAEFSPLTWITGFITTLILPLTILLALHGVLRIPIGKTSGTTILLFFGWATSSQAILTISRLKAVASWKVAVIMLGCLVLVTLTYLTAAESFSQYLFPAPGEVDYEFATAALPPEIFDLLVVGFALVIVIGWILIYARSHGRTIRVPNIIRRLQVRVYLFLLNRLYLEVVSMRLRQLITPTVEHLAGSSAFTYGTLLLAAGCLFLYTPVASLQPIFLLVAAALLLPLFPFYGLYFAALTRLPAYAAAAAAVLLPVAGLYIVGKLSPMLSGEALHAVSAVALLGALYFSIRVLARGEFPELLACAAGVFFSAFWWRFGATATVSADLSVYVIAASVLIGGLLFAWERLRVRVGDVTLDSMHGLARPMPLFSTLFALLIMAAIGLYPFGLFSSYIGILTAPGVRISTGVWIILFTWFLISWYFVRTMQRLLFGSYRRHFPVPDFHAAEAIALVAVLAVMTILAFAPRDWWQIYEFPAGYVAFFGTRP